MGGRDGAAFACVSSDGAPVDSLSERARGDDEAVEDDDEVVEEEEDEVVEEEDRVKTS